MTGVFLQVRLDSTRLPGKAILPLGDYTVIEQAMRALQIVNADVFALLTDFSSYRELAPLAEKWGYEVFVGDKVNVLRRYSDAIKYFSVSTVIRATGDNPLVSGKLANQILEYHLLKKSDYSAYIGMPLGTGVEILKAEALLIADNLSDNPYEKEHVSPYLYFRDEKFLISRVPAPAEYYCPGIRVTVDTLEDYDNIKKIYRYLYHGEPIGIEELVSLLRSKITDENFALAQ